MKNNSLYNYSRENFVIPFRLWVYKMTRKVLIIFILALVANFVFSYYLHTPKMWQLRAQNSDIIAQYNTLLDNIEQSKLELQEIKCRDMAQYRSVFSVDTLNIPNIWTDYPEQQYANVGYGRYGELMKTTKISLDRLSKQMYGQSLSFDQLEQLALNKDIMVEHLPTLWPLDRTKLRKKTFGKFGMRLHPILKRNILHKGIDFTGHIGEPIYATGDGLIMRPRGISGFGIQIMINHGYRYETRYAHLSKSMVKVGQKVKRGDLIGLLGNTGRSTGPHLHYEIIHRRKPVDPLNYLNKGMSKEEFEEILSNARSIAYEDV